MEQSARLNDLLSVYFQLALSVTFYKGEIDFHQDWGNRNGFAWGTIHFSDPID